MTKNEFLSKLSEKLKIYPQNEVSDRLDFYSEMLDDMIDDGITEEEAVSRLGGVDEVFLRIISDIPLTAIVKERMRPKRKMRTWEIVLISIGSPVWVPVLIALLAVAFSLYIVLWMIDICLWAVFVSFAASFIGGIVSGIVFISRGHLLAGISMIGAGIMLAGLAILMFFISKLAAKAIVKLTAKMMLLLKKCFAKKEEE